MIDNIYGALPAFILFFVGYVVWHRERDFWNKFVFGCLAFFYVAFLTAQYVAGTYSPSLQSLLLSSGVGIAIALAGLKTKTGWPLLCSGLLLANGLLDFYHFSYVTMNGTPSWNLTYQHAGAVLYYLACFVLLVHPTIETGERRDNGNWVWA